MKILTKILTFSYFLIFSMEMIFVVHVFAVNSNDLLKEAVNPSFQEDVLLEKEAGELFYDRGVNIKLNPFPGKDSA